RGDRALVAVDQKAEVRPALERDRRARHDDGGAPVAPHRVKRYADVARHSFVRTRPGPCRGGARRGRTIPSSPRKATPIDPARVLNSAEKFALPGKPPGFCQRARLTRLSRASSARGQRAPRTARPSSRVLRAV